MRLRKRVAVAVVLVLLAVVSTCALFTPSARWTPDHDLSFHLARIQSIAAGLRSGVIPVRLYACQASGFGYPTGICYPDLFLYLPATLVALGMHPWPAYVTFVLMTNLATAGIGYHAFKVMFRSRRTGLVCTTLWTLAPYRLCDVLLRAAVGEYLALTFVPLIALGLWRVFLDDTTPEGAGWKTLALGASGVIYSHILSVIMFLPAALIAMVPLVRNRKKDGWQWAIGKAAVLTILMCAAFLVPFFDYYLHHDLGVKYFGNSSYDHALIPGQFLVPFQPFRGLSNALTEGPFGEMPLEIGLSLTAVLVLGFVWWRVPTVRQKGDDSQGRWVRFLVWAATVVLLLTTCLFPWGIAGPFATIQFPWRLLGVATIFLVLLAGLLMGCTSERLRPFWVVCLALCLIEGVYCEVSFAVLSEPLEVTMTTVEGKDIGMGEYVPIQQSMHFADDWDAFEPVAPQGVEVLGFERVTPQEWHVTLANRTTDVQQVRLPMFWHNELQISGGSGAGLVFDEGYVAVQLEANASGTYVIAFVEPLLWRIAELASLVTVLAIGGLSIMGRK